MGPDRFTLDELTPRACQAASAARAQDDPQAHDYQQNLEEIVALITCRECGQEVADSAPTCPKCGVPNPAGRTCTLRVHRKGQLSSAAMRADVALDQAECGSLRPGQTLEIELTPGEHLVAVLCGSKVRKESFEVHGGETVEYMLTFGGLKGMTLRRI